jgi:hypothetical protein
LGQGLTSSLKHLSSRQEGGIQEKLSIARNILIEDIEQAIVLRVTGLTQAQLNPIAQEVKR